MRIAICDDQQHGLEHTLTKIRTVSLQSEIAIFLKISDLFQQIKEGVKFDAVLMDIEWDGEDRSGIDFASELYSLSPKTKIIFVTGYPERYSQQIFLKNTNLRGFIAKPIDADILLKNLEKLKDEMLLEENRKLILKFNGVIKGVDSDDILYLESKLHTVTVYTTDGEHLCYEKLSDLAKRLPRQFVTTHKSFLVNMDKIQRIERERIVLGKNIEIPVSKARYNEVREHYFRYIGSNMWGVR
ncbi:MAG: LytTR family DNA-binding domain-containing protein [Defluviitaleaceae bacterium]|nr:LytTR family DNA-binding domain-containing protein [Defluviitaleaceae bacterium]